MKEMILQAIFDFSKDEDGNLQNINKNALGFLAEEIYKQVKSAMCEANSNAVLAEVRAELNKLHERPLYDYALGYKDGLMFLEKKISEHFT